MKPFPMTLVLGGAASGKSEFAEKLAGDLGGRILYLATGLPGRAASRTPEWRKKIRAHRARRPKPWRTEILNGRPVEKLIPHPRPSGILLDSLTLWAAARCSSRSAETLAREFVDLASALASCAPVVVVSDEVGMGLVPASRSGRAFLNAIGRINAAAAKMASRVYFVVSGQPILIKEKKSS